MFKCIECGRTFETPARWEEGRGECFGFPAYEPMEGCPYCHGEYMTEEEYKRDILGEDDEEESEDKGDG